MKLSLGSICTALSLITLPMLALAEQSGRALVPLPSLEDFTKGQNGLAVGLGLGIEYESAYEGSDEYELELDPAGALQWRQNKHIFYWAGEAFGWRTLASEKWLFDSLLGFEEGREEGDSDEGRLDGLGESEEGFELALQTRYAFDDDWRYWLDARIVASENGNLGLFGFGRRFGANLDGTGHEITFAAVFHDSEYANTDFGITGEQAASSGLAETELDGGFRSMALHYNYRQYIKPKWQVFGEFFYEGYGSDIKDSPIAREEFEAEVGVGFLYIF